MVLSIKKSAPASYYWQHSGLEARSELADCNWLSGSYRLGRATISDYGDDKRGKDEEALTALLSRHTADDGKSAMFNRIEGMRGHDFVFSAPKSVSLLWAFSDKTKRAMIEDAHDTAVRAAVTLLNEFAIRERVGKGGQLLFPAKAAAAAFMHVLGRPALHHGSSEPAFPDPNLHTHVVVPDLVEANERPNTKQAGAKLSRAKKRKVSTFKIAYTAFYGRWAMTLGAWYHATLAHELTKLGLPLKSSGPNGLFQIKGVDSDWITAFSARSLGADGRKSLRGRRNARSMQTADVIQASWDTHARQINIPKGCLFQTLTGTVAKPPPFVNHVRARRKTLTGILTALAGETAVLQEQDFYRGLASALVERGIFAMPDRAHIEEFKALPEIEGIEPSTSYRLEQWTTRKTLSTEAKVEQIAIKLAHMPTASVTIGPYLVKNSGPALSPAQIRIAMAIAGDDGKLSVLCGPPGSGKTTLLRPVVDGFVARYGPASVIGAAMAWMQALQLTSGLGIEGFSIASLLAAKSADRSSFDKVKLLIVDEAGLLPSETMAKLLDFALRHRMKLILVGDTGQLDPIGAGSGLAIITSALEPHVLTEIKRQANPVLEKITAALVDLSSLPPGPGGANCKDGSPAARLAALITDNNLWTSELSSAAAAKTVATILFGSRTETENGSSPMQALMRSHRQAQHVTRLLRTMLYNNGDLENDEVAFPARTPMGGGYLLKIASGDRIRFLQRRPKLGIFNGTEAKVLNIDCTVADLQITVLVLRGSAHEIGPERRLTFKLSDIACPTTGRAMLSCAYATTIFGSQGATYDNVVILKSTDMKFRELYVAMTRSRSSCQIIDVDWKKALHDESYVPRDGSVVGEITKELVSAKQRDRRKPLAQQFLVSQCAKPPKPWDFHAMCRDTQLDLV